MHTIINVFENQIGVLMVWPFTTKKEPFTDGLYHRFSVPLVNIDDVWYFVDFLQFQLKKWRETTCQQVTILYRLKQPSVT